ncbi:unnamed protein product [Prunus armeniaca]
MNRQTFEENWGNGNWPTTCADKWGRQVAEEILVGQLYTKHKYMKTSKGNWEQGNWPTTCADKSSRWVEQSSLGSSTLNTATCKH